MIKSESYKSYCETLGEALKEYAKKAIEKKKQSMSTTTEFFQTGYLISNWLSYFKLVILFQTGYLISNWLSYFKLVILFQTGYLISNWLS